MYRRKQVEEMTGLPARRIHFYTDQGLLPAVEKSTGRGIERKYSKDDVFRLAIIREMAELGLALQAIKTFLMEEEKTKAYYKALGVEYFERISFKSFSQGQRCFFVNERMSDDSQVFAILTPRELQDRLKRHFLIGQGEITDNGVGTDLVTSQVIIDLGNIFSKINWL